MSCVAGPTARSWCWLIYLQTAGTRYWTCMAYYQNTTNSDAQSTTPNQHDYDEPVTIYSHLDSTTIGAAPTGAR